MIYTKPIPKATPETQEFWEGLRRRELRIQYCNECLRYYFYPRPFCPFRGCRSQNVTWETVSGFAKLYSYVISHRGFGGFEDDIPYVIAVVELNEGPRMMTNIINVDPEPKNLIPDMPLEIVFDEITEEVTLPKFQPMSG